MAEPRSFAPDNRCQGVGLRLSTDSLLGRRASEILQTFSWPTDSRMYDDPANCYEDYYEELYEYYHD